MNNPRSNLVCRVLCSQSETGRQTVLTWVKWSVVSVTMLSHMRLFSKLFEKILSINVAEFP